MKHGYCQNKCAHCGETFLARNDCLKMGRGKFCSKQCSGKGTYQHIPVAERFWSKVKKTDGCWLWLAGKNNGYGQFSIGPRGSAKHMVASRMAFILEYGAIENGKYVCHHCDNRACVNPSHLFIGTAADNQADMAIKGRAKRLHGETNGQAKITAEDVKQIRALRGKIPYGKIANRYGVSLSAIAHVMTGRSWSHIK